MPIFGSFTGARMFGKGGGGGQMQASSSGNNQTPASGLEPGNGYVYHTFSGPGTFTVEEAGQAEIMVLGGGGGGAGHAASGGGGAGGMAVAHEQPLTIGSYSITVGGGGSNGPQHNLSYSGADSVFSGNGVTITGQGGGGAGAYGQGQTGGCAGGAAGYPSWYGGQASQTVWGATNNPSYTKNFGAHGGYRWYGQFHCGSGGGGTQQAGENAPSASGMGHGGDGMQWPQFDGPLIGMPGLGNGGYFGGGGAGGGWSENASTRAGGLGGGGRGNAPIAGQAHLGAGGGGANGYYYTNTGQGGGAGIVVIRYNSSSPKVYNNAGGDGLTSSNPGTSAYQILQDYPNSQSGYYYIQMETGVNLVHCDMTTDDGGWMLVHRNNGTGTSGISNTRTSSAVGSITGATPGTTSGSISNDYKWNSADIMYMAKYAIPGRDRPSGHTLQVFKGICGDWYDGGSGDTNYWCFYVDQPYGHDAGMPHGYIDFQGGPRIDSGKNGSCSIAGWTSYNDFLGSPRTYTNAAGYQFPYTGWGDVLFYNHGGWGNGSIYHSPNSGHYKGSTGTWTSSGGLWIR